MSIDGVSMVYIVVTQMKPFYLFAFVQQLRGRSGKVQLLL